MTPEERAQQVLNASQLGPKATTEEQVQALETALGQLTALLQETQE